MAKKENAKEGECCGGHHGGYGHGMFMGALFLIVGILLLLSNYGILTTDLIKLWPIVFVILGIKKLMKHCC